MIRKAPSVRRESRRRGVSEGLLKGKSYREIAAELATSPATVKRDVDVVLSRWRDESLQNIDDHVRLDLERIDAALAVVLPQVEEGSLPAVDRLVHLINLRARLLGLFQPAKVEAELSVHYLDRAREESVIAEFEEVQDAAQQIISQYEASESGRSTGGVAKETKSLGP